MIDGKLGIIRSPSFEKSFMTSLETCDIELLVQGYVEIWGIKGTVHVSNCSSDISRQVSDCITYLKNYQNIEITFVPRIILLQGSVYGIFAPRELGFSVPWRDYMSFKANLWHYIHECVEFNAMSLMPGLPRWLKEGMAQLASYNALSNLYGNEDTDALVISYYGKDYTSLDDIRLWPAETGFINLNDVEDVDSFLKNKVFEKHQDERAWYAGILVIFRDWQSKGFKLSDAFNEAILAQEEDNFDKLFNDWKERYS